MLEQLPGLQELLMIFGKQLAEKVLLEKDLLQEPLLGLVQELLGC